MRNYIFCLISIIILTACGDNSEPIAPDAGTVMPVDARVADAATPDAAPIDAASPDAALPDAAAPDAAAPDAAAPDAALPDAAPPEPAFLYWANTGGSVWRLALDGSEPEEIVTGASGLFVVATDPVSRTLFYHDSSGIVRAAADGSDPVTVVATNDVFGLAVDSDSGKVYWSEFAGERVLRADLDGSNLEVVLDSGTTSPSGLGIDSARGTFYVVNYNSTALHRSNLDGSGFETVASGLGGQGVAVSVDPANQRVYVSLRDDAIRVSDLDGSNMTTFVSGQSVVQGLAVDSDDGMLYWTALSADTGGFELRRAPLDDSANVEVLATANGNSWGIALMLAP